MFRFFTKQTMGYVPFQNSSYISFHPLTVHIIPNVWISACFNNTIFYKFSTPTVKQNPQYTKFTFTLIFLLFIPSLVLFSIFVPYRVRFSKNTLLIYILGEPLLYNSSVLFYFCTFVHYTVQVSHCLHPSHPRWPACQKT